MKTVSGGPNESLLLWRQNGNGSNIFVCGDAFLKSDYLALFRGLENSLRSSRTASFVDLWKDAVRNACGSVSSRVAKASGAKSAQVDLVAKKFRGNAAEIFAEKLFSEGRGLFRPGTYSVVDPHREEGVDATAVSAISGLEVGIQVKNYATEKVGISVFRTAGDESDKRSHALKPSDFELFLSHPNQYVLSFTDAEDALKKSYEGRVGFLGPKWIDRLGLQGGRGEKSGRWLLFKEIADEIEAAAV